MMGLTDSLYHYCQAVTWSKTIALGYRRELGNNFRWQRVAVSFPGYKGCYCKRPWVYKQKDHGLIVADLFIYVENGRSTVPTEDILWQSSRKWGSMCSCLGIQYASSRVKPPLQAPVPLAVTVNTNEEVFYGLVPQYWWYKTRGLIQEGSNMEERENNRDGMDRVMLDSMRVFFVYFSRKYQYMNPYLEELHLTIDSWRPHMYGEGCKLQGQALNIVELEGKLYGLEQIDYGKLPNN